MSNTTKNESGPLHLTTRELNKFQISLQDTAGFGATCVKCNTGIRAIEDSEYVTLYAAGKAEGWGLHIVCFEDILQGMMEFYKVFIVEKQKKKVTN